MHRNINYYPTFKGSHRLQDFAHMFSENTINLTQGTFNDMFKKGKSNVHVVYEGRKPGIYFSWPEAKMQVCHFSDCCHVGYASFQEAEVAWVQFC